MGTSILAIGMVSALGLGWETSCCASRAGISRAAALDHCRVQAGDPWSVEFLVGHQIDLLTKGFERRARLLRLLAGALKDLRRSISEIGRDHDSIPVYLCLPDPNRTLSNAELMLDPEARKESQEQLAAMPLTMTLDEAALLVAEAAALAEWPGRIRLAAVSHSGHTGTLDMFERCLADMASAHCDYAIAGAVDSMLDDETVAWLVGTGRLKTPALASGLIPGEAGVLFFMSRSYEESGRMGVIESLAFDREDHAFESGKAALGRGLSRVVRQIAHGTKWPGQDPPWILTDQNGEAYRASDWGWALHRLTAANAIFSATQLWFPAVSFGDTGSAGAALGVACALAAWRRGYAPSNRCCILASSDGAKRGGLLMSAPQS